MYSENVKVSDYLATLCWSTFLDSACFFSSFKIFLQVFHSFPPASEVFLHAWQLAASGITGQLRISAVISEGSDGSDL